MHMQYLHGQLIDLQVGTGVRSRDMCCKCRWGGIAHARDHGL